MIVCDPNVCGGRWRFANSRLLVYTVVANVKSDGREWTLENYPTLTDAMIDEALAWPFPQIGQAGIVIESADVYCVCGEEAVSPSEGEFDHGDQVYTCQACGKRWRLTVRLDRDWTPLG